MSLTHMKRMTAHRRAALVLCAMLPAWTTAALAQVTTTTSTAAPRASTPRAQCVGCADSTRARRGLLASKLDSLRMEFERRRLTTAEREVLAKEMTTTIMALEELIDASMRAGFSEMRVQDFPRATTGGVRRSLVPGQITVTVQTGAKRGYLGVTFDGPMLSDGERDSVRFFAYPLIASVDPSSPAERAGVLRGDTLIALNGTDVVDHLFSFTKLLVPDEKVTMKVRRQGDAKEFRIVVGEAPAYVVQRLPFRPFSGYAPEVRVGAVPVPRSRGGARPPDAPEPSIAFAYPGRVLLFSSDVGGARVESVSEGLAKNLGIKGGLHVRSVSPGSPAYEWGLRDGDIILTAADETMSVVQDFARLVADRNRTSDDVKLVILRDKKQQELILK